jgi:site-specific DNA recombinase
MSDRKRVRCAIYTRKSSEEGLDQDFNSLDAQREACEAYIASQKAEGWVALPEYYDDGGISGGTLERPALQRMLDDIDAGKADQIVVYKIDRLTRSLADFAKLVEKLEKAGASFVSVTQSFNTATSMGRLTLNVLLSFAQFAREVTAERIRDKIAASKKKGMWMGGLVPFGYAANGRTLCIVELEAKTIRTLYKLYLELGTVRAVQSKAQELDLRSRTREQKSGARVGGIHFGRGHIHQILTNPLYAGRIRHKDKVYDGQHPAIIDAETWESIQAMLKAQAARSRLKANVAEPSPLIGKLFDETGDRLTPSHASKRGVRYRYYISHRLVRQSGEKELTGWRLPAKALEEGLATTLVEELERPAFLTRVLPSSGASELKRILGRIDVLVSELNGVNKTLNTASLIAEARIGVGNMEIRLDLDVLSKKLGVPKADLFEDALVFNKLFQLRKRGVETKLVLGGIQVEPDQTLIRNIVAAQKWLKAIRQGKTIEQIAKDAELTKPRILQMMDHAFLAPDIVKQIAAGKQPVGLTSEWLQRNALPIDWQEQRQVIAIL